MMGRDLRSTSKTALERVLVATGLPRRWLRHRSPRDRILAYHNVVPTGAEPGGDRSLHIPQERFGAHLDLLAETFEIVPLDRLRTEPGGAHPRVAITFDDGYRGTITAGAAELRRRGLTATVFICPAMLGAGPFWWDAFQRAGTSLTPDDREHALTSLAGVGARIEAWASSRGYVRSGQPEHAQPATAAELCEAVRLGGLSIGSHTWSHVNLAEVRDPDLEDELARPLRWAREAGLPMQPILAYPYGRCRAEAVESAIRVGYTAGFGLEAPQPDQRFSVSRLNVPAAMSAHGLLLRLAWQR